MTISSTGATRVDPPVLVPGNNTIVGTPLNDILIGGPGNDDILGRAGDDKLGGEENNDRLFGEEGNDRLVGGTGNDLLNGGTGADAMFGQYGNDTYVVDDAGDTVFEAAGRGLDQVFASVDFTLPENIENLQLYGRTDVDGVGNGLSNILSGNTGNFNVANSLTGGGGNDELYGRDGTDTLSGGDGNDLLDGGTGADQMAGGMGDDIYYVDDSGDQISEDAGAGTDLVYTDFSEVMADNVENLILTGDLNSRVFGNDSGNIIRGNTGRNTLDGGNGEDELIGAGGSDVLIGGMGSDKLRGGADPDLFLFNSTAESVIGRNRDVIVDVESVDRIDLSRIDADEITDGNQAFTYLGTDEFTNTAGQVRYDNSAIRIDTDGDGVDDMQILIANNNDLTADNFIL